MKRPYVFHLLFATLFFAAFSPLCRAQNFPWNEFKERKIADVIEITRKAFRPDDSLFLATNQLETRAEVTFTGKWREMSRSRKAFLQWWVGMLHHDQEDYADLYDIEYAYIEGGKEYWLPTETPITNYFAKELKPNDKMVLFLISAGAYRDKGNIDCVVLVEEYQLPQNLDKVLKKTDPKNNL